MDTTGRLLRHMRWANQQVFAAITQLPDEALSAYIVNPEWQAGQIMQHMVRAARLYQSMFWPDEKPEDVPLPTSMDDVRALAAALDAADARAADAVIQPDERFTVHRRGVDLHVERGTVLSQAVHHATEHRAQLVDALNSRGYEPISLDDLSLWHFEAVDRQG